VLIRILAALTQLGFVVIASCQQLLWMMEPVDSWLTLIEVSGCYPFGVDVAVSASGPAFLGERMMLSAHESETVDVGHPRQACCLETRRLSLGHLADQMHQL
jgi:hypothetical protein